MDNRETATTAAGEPPDFEPFVTAQYDRVYRTIRRLVRDPIDAQDLTQETFFRAYRSWSGFRAESSRSTWVLRIAQNLVRDRSRRATRGTSLRTVPWDELVAMAVDPSGTPARVAQQRQCGECVQRCVQELPEIYRQVVYLHDLLGFSSTEIAGRAGMSVEAVKMRVHRGREQFRARCAVSQGERDELFCGPAAGRGDHGTC